MKNVLIMADADRTYFAQAELRLRAKGIAYSFGDPLRAGEEDLIRQAEGSAAVIAGSESWTRRVLENCRNLKAIVRCGTGYDGIDMDAAEELGIQVANTPGINVYAVAEMALSMILCLQRKLKMYDCGMRKGQWGPLKVRELRGKTVGLIGFGGVARQLARLMAPFDCTLKAYDVCRDEAAAEELGVRYGQLEEILRTSDIISLHLPLLPSTKHMICRETLAMMKEECILVNTSRGGIVNTEDLCEALKNHVIAGAGLDVHETEPVPADYSLLLESGVILSPHVASATKETTAAMIQESVNEVVSFFESGTMTHLVHPCVNS